MGHIDQKQWTYTSSTHIHAYGHVLFDFFGFQPGKLTFQQWWNVLAFWLIVFFGNVQTHGRNVFAGSYVACTEPWPMRTFWETPVSEYRLVFIFLLNQYIELLSLGVGVARQCRPSQKGHVHTLEWSLFACLGCACSDSAGRCHSQARNVGVTMLAVRRLSNFQSDS